MTLKLDGTGAITGVDQGLNVVGVGTYSTDLNVGGNLNVSGVLTYDDVTNIDSVGVVTARSGIHVTGGSIGVGTDNPLTKTHIDGTNGDNSTLFITASDLGADYGGTISLGGNYDGTNKTAFSQIKGLKDNNTSGQYGGYLSFLTRAHGGSPSERFRITSAGKVGIGTDDPAEKLSVDGIIESTSHLGDSATEGGQLVLRAPRNQTGSKYRYAIDNYWGEASHGRAGGAGNEVSGIRFIREDDSPAANGQVLMSIAEDGILYLPYQPAFDAVYDSGSGGNSVGTANTEIVFNVVNNNRGNHFNTSTGRFTAPISGSYFFSIGAMSNNGSGQPAWYELRVNGNLLSNPHNPYMSVQNGTGFRHVTSQYVLQLNDGDYVSVFTGTHTGGLYGGGNNHNHFVGYLIG